MSLADRVEAIVPARDARMAMVRSENAFARRLAESMGPSTDDTQFRQRLTLLIALRDKLGVVSGGSATTFASSLESSVIPVNYRYIRDTMQHHFLRKWVFTDAALQTKAVEIATADGPIWNRLRSAMLANEAENGLGSLARMYEDGTAESAGAIRGPVTDFFARLEQLDSGLHGRATNGVLRALPGGPTVTPAARIDYTNGPATGTELPIGVDPPPAGASSSSSGRSGSRTSTGPATSSTPGWSSGASSDPLSVPVPDFASGGGGSAIRPYDGGEPPRSGTGDTIQKVRLIRAIARDLNIGVPAVVRAIINIYTLYTLIRRGQRMLGAGVAADDNETGSATVDELRQLGSVAEDEYIPSTAAFHAPAADPVSQTFGRRF